MTRAGVLRHRVTFQSHESGEDAAGQPVDEWVDHVTVWAEVRDLRGREFLEAQQAPGGEVTTQVRIRYRDDLTRQQRIQHSGRVLEIVAIIDPDGRREELQLMCREAS